MYIVTVIGLFFIYFFFYQPNTMPMIRQEYKNYYNTRHSIVHMWCQLKFVTFRNDLIVLF